MRLLPCCVWAGMPVLLASCASVPVAYTRDSAIRTVHQAVSIGDRESRAIAKLERSGFRCRQLAPGEYASLGPEPTKFLMCHTEADRTETGYALVYASLSVNRAGRVTEVHADGYPVIYRNLRKDAHGRTIVVHEVRPVVAEDNLQGRWTITTVNGRQVSGLWIELGGEGLATITKSGNGVFVASPQPPTRAHLGCNDWYPSGWTRNGDKLILGREMSRRTERGCDDARMALDDEAYAILNETMSMEFTPPSRLRLINATGTLELVRGGG